MGASMVASPLFCSHSPCRALVAISEAALSVRPTTSLSPIGGREELQIVIKVKLLSCCLAAKVLAMPQMRLLRCPTCSCVEKFENERIAPLLVYLDI